VALGADYGLAATPGFVEGGFEYYSVDGAERLRDELLSFRGGKVDILRATSTKFGFTVEALLGPGRFRDLVKARHIAMWLYHNQIGLSYPAVAKILKRQDHTTVMYAVGKIDELVIRHPHAASQVMELRARLEMLPATAGEQRTSV